MTAALGQVGLISTAGTFVVVGGIAKARQGEFATLGVFQGLQRALEAARRKLNVNAPAIRADGDIGSTTLTTLRAVALAAQATSFRSGPELLSLANLPIAGVATNASRLANLLAQLGQVGVDFAPNVAAQPPQVPTVPGQVQPLAPPSKPKSEGGVHWGFWVGGVALLGLAGFLGYRFFGRPGTFAGGDGYDDYDYEEAAGDFIDV